MAADSAADIDLYAGVDELDPEIHQGEPAGLDLYDDVLTTRAELPPESEEFPVQYQPDDSTTAEVSADSSGAVPTTGYEYKSYTTVHPKSIGGHSTQSTFDRPRGKPLYVGNLTWWTNDQDLTEALQECGITDLINIKFFENRTNGQSKGFAMIELGSDTSVRLVTDKLPQLEINGQNPVVTPATKIHLQQFESQSRKSNPPGPGREGDYGRPEGGFGGPPGRGGFGYRGGFRGRGGRGYGPRPGMGRDFEHGEHPEMGRGGPWMGPGGVPGGPRPPPPGVPPYGEHLPPFPQGMPGMPPEKPVGAVPPQMMPYAQQPPPPGAGFPPEQRQDWGRGPVAPHVNPAFFPEGPPPEMFPGMAASGARMDFSSMYHQARPGDNYGESLQTNQALASSAIKRAMADSNAGDYESGIETLVRAISLIKQSPVAQDEKSQVLVQSLQDFIQGLDAQLLERSKSNRKEHDKEDYDSERRHRKKRTRSRSRSRDRERKTRERRSRSRSRERERHRRR